MKWLGSHVARFPSLIRLGPQPEWSISEVHDFLEMCRPKLGAKVDMYKQLMAEQDIDGEVLNDMGDDELNK
jgi:hypothetical protein